ncbi:MAG: hypothetical protein QOH08_1538, partial [Chloroflexota bacterium]|nr:hypothetical protein [Chloroflexota bacterium]
MADAVRAAVPTARLAGLLARAEESPAFHALVDRVGTGGTVAVADASAGARAYAWSALVATQGRTVLLVAPSEDRARRWRAELAGWLGEDRVVAFPERESMPYEAGSPSASSVHQRLLALWRLRDREEHEPIAVVASLRAVMQWTVPADTLAERGRALRPGATLPWQKTAAWLLSLGYEPVPEVSEPGTFSRRGGIIDVYPASATEPARIELFGDDIESIRSFDPVTQRSQAALDELVVLPAREISVERGPEIAERIASAGWDGLGENLTDHIALLEGLRQGQYAPGVDAFAPLLGATASLVSHLPPDRATVVFEDSVELALAWDAYEAQAEERREELRADGLPVTSFPAPYVPRTQLERESGEHGAIRVAPADNALRLGWTGSPSYAGRLDQFLREVAADGTGTRVIATPQAARLSELLAERDVTATPQESLADPPAPGALVLLHVPLAEGFAIPELDLRVFTDAEVFGFRKPRHPERRRRRVAVGSFLQDLKPGDHVVHEDSGIARFEGFETKQVVGVEREYLILTFADGTRWLPTDRIDKITRYVGGQAPALSVMGGRDWLKTKGKAKRAAAEIARELLRLYAAREATPGHAFGKDTPWQIEMENAFPFTETPDQLLAIEETKKDMERAQPMDRLIVGDV